MKQFLKYLLGFFALLFLVVNLISFGSLYSLNKSDFYKPCYLVNSIDEVEYDYVIIGASTGLTTLNTTIIDSITGMNGFNLSIDDTGMANHYLMLKHFLAEGKKTASCILVASAEEYGKNQEFIGDNDYRFLPFIKRSYVQNYFSSLKPKSAINVLKWSEWMPFLGVSYYNIELFFPSLIATVKPSKRNRFDSKGNYAYPNRKLNNDTKKPKTNIRVSFKSDYLNKLKELCHDHNIELIYYFSPLRTKSLSFDDEFIKSIDHSNIFKDDTYFYDDIHVNTYGNKKASLLFAYEFINNY
ncbi:hypothetical protein [Cognatitamlana onchidii]|uniref:hypothetical protein n=1 Tax=Cognatitamlana onchidii TaxID=2562860 RepID=UPI0010A68B70|nr:hypothetical protein [Algibacter onchidii]